MPLRPLTIALNANHTRKFVYLFDDDVSDAKACILREAHNKFRIRSLKHVFLQGGAELGDEEQLHYSAVQVFVSKGEVYNGRTDSTMVGTTTHGEVRIIAEKSFVDSKAVAQLEAVAALTGVHLACGMPDLHPGDRFPVGCAVIADRVYPALIGSDIGCGIGLYKLSSSSRAADNPAKLASLLRGLDERWGGSAADWLSKYGLESRTEFEATLGTVGLGNHFAEICTVEEIVDEDVVGRLDIQASGLYLLGALSPSRGPILGH